TVDAVGGESGAVSICSEASRLTSIDTWPSSARRMSGVETRMIGSPSAGEPPVEGTPSEVTTGRPHAEPPFMVRFGYSYWPSAFCINEICRARRCDISTTQPVTCMFAVRKVESSVFMSERNAAPVVPDGICAETPLVIDAGDTPETADFVGS